MAAENILRAKPAESSIAVRNCAVILLLFVAACSVPPSQILVPRSSTAPLTQIGIASWYGPGFHGKPTASGTIYDQNEFTAAHQTLPLGTRLIVTNLENGRSTELLVTDRGPFAKGRILDLSYAAGEALGIIVPGTIPVRLQVIASPTKIQAIPASLDYTLQLGSFLQLENAQQLRDRVVKSFADVTIIPLQLKDSTFYRVQLGNFANRAAAEEQARAVAQSGLPVIILEK